MFKNNLNKLREKMKEKNVDLTIITDDDNLYYFTGYHDFLHMDFNRPTILLVPKDDQSILITPLLDVLLVPEDTPVEKVETWNDGIGLEWRECLPKIIKNHNNIYIEKFKINATVNNYLSELLIDKNLNNITPIINDIRMIKSDQELKIARHAGEVAMAMMEGAKSVIGHNVPEYEIALAQSQAAGDLSGVVPEVSHARSLRDNMSHKAPTRLPQVRQTNCSIHLLPYRRQFFLPGLLCF